MIHCCNPFNSSDEFLVGFRFIVDEGHDAGLNFEDCVAIAKIFEASGMVDFFNAIYGRMDTAISLAVDNMPGMSSPIAPWLQRAGVFKQEVSLPVFHAARITDIATARHAIREGLLDLVGMTRAQIADPHLVAKLAAGNEGQIRPCVGATHCMSELRPTCLHNPATGHEAFLHHKIEPAARKRRVVVVGAGPAGLEAARVCGERGHDVVIFEAAAKPGGQVLLAAQAEWRKDVIGIVDWRVSELERLGVTIKTSVLAETDDIIAEQPDLVIIATGGVPNLEWLPGHENVTSGWDILSGSVTPGDDVVIVDGTGRHTALSTADYCHRKGARVRFVTIDETLAAEQAYAERVVWRKWVHEVGLPVHHEEQLREVSTDGNRLTATLQNELTGDLSMLSADQIVFDYGTIPAAEVFFALQSQSSNGGVTDLETLASGLPQNDARASDQHDEAFELHRIGDAISSRNIHSAVLDALRLCQNC